MNDHEKQWKKETDLETRFPKTDRGSMLKMRARFVFRAGWSACVL